MKEKKFRGLWPQSPKQCSTKRFIRSDLFVEYGSILIIISYILLQSYYIVFEKDFLLAYVSLILNLFFLTITLQKLGSINITWLNLYVDSALKLLIFIYLLNFLLYLFIDSLLYNYIYAPISILGAYFSFLLLSKKDLSI